MERAAVAYRVKDRVVIGSIVRTSTGLLLDVAPRGFDTTGEELEAMLAEALRVALAGSGKTVPHPSREAWATFFAPFQAAAGVTSRAAFMRHAARVEVRQVGEVLRLTPDRNLGAAAGFEPRQDRAVETPGNDLTAAARALLSLLELVPPES